MSAPLPGQTGPQVLAVDLDGTLLRSDMLYESYWAAQSAHWHAPLVALRGLARGRSALKRDLAALCDIDVTRLPYNEEVVDFVRQWRDRGGRTILVTASDQGFADRIARHLDLFDEVAGSDGTTNLKGPAKAAFLVSRYGEGGYAYVGDSPADLPVWQSAGGIVAVAPSPSLARKIRALDSSADIIAASRPAGKAALRALRPHQWLKNVLVFLPMLTAHRFDAATLFSSLIAFVAFSLIASSVYVLNDLLDLSADRAHPRKRNRPLASGAVSIPGGMGLAAGCLVGGFGAAALLGWPFVLAMLGYYLLTTAYSLNLKRRVIIDICVLAMLYTMRVLAGGVATDIPLSVWLLAFSLFFFLSLAAIKRQAELVDAAAAGTLKPHGRGYQSADLEVVSQLAVSAGQVSILVMALYVNSPQVVALYSHPPFLWGICVILLYWINRMVLMTHRGHMHDDPIVFATRDRVSLICGLLAMACIVAGAVL